MSKLEALLDAQYGWLFENKKPKQQQTIQQEPIQDTIGEEMGESMEEEEDSDGSSEDNQVVEIEFNENQSIRQAMDKSFMKTKVSLKQKPTKKEEKQDKEDDQHDKELMDLLKESKLIEKFNESELQGKERLKNLRSKMGLAKPKAPFPIHLGMKKAAKKRVGSKLQEAKDTGMWNKSTKTKLLKEEGLYKPKNYGKAQKKKNSGIYGSVGTIKDGIMYVSQKHINKVEKRR